MDTQRQQPDAWIVLDNSDDPSQDWSVAQDHPLVIYHRVDEKQPIGALRNQCLALALAEGADYILFWDDDDYYPPTRISSGMQALETHPDADIAGSSLMYILLTKENVLMTTGPFHDRHATAATWTLRRRCAETHRFDASKTRGEEVTFTNQWQVPVTQVSPEETIVVMGHARNTVDKSDLFKRPHMYLAKTVNADNGKQAFRSRWPVPWDLWKSTFSV